MRRLVLFGVFGLLAACGGGGGGGGNIADGPAYWGIPFPPSAASHAMVVGLKNLEASGTTVKIIGHRPDGTAYAAPLLVTLDGFDEHRLTAAAAKGAVPAGGWIEVDTPSRRVDVYSVLFDAGTVAEEASRAAALPDLVAPPPLTTAAIATNALTDFVQVSNASALATAIAVTAYQEPASDPLLPPVVSTPAVILLAANATTLLSPDAISGITGFVGSFEFSSPNPFFVAAIEESGSIALDVPRSQDLLETKIVSLDFGHETFGGLLEDFLDFAMIVKNDTGVGRALTVNHIRLPDGFDLIAAPRTIFLAPHETRIVDTTEFPFDDVYGDVFSSFAVSRTNLELIVADGVDVSFRQFDPSFLDYSMTQRPASQGHRYAAMDIVPVDTLPSDIRTFVTVMNPNAFAIDVRVDAHIPEPDGFDVVPLTLTTLTIPAHGSERFSPDGVTYFDHTLTPVGFIGLFFQSGTPFSVNGYRETRDPSGPLVALSPTVTRNFDVFD